MAAPTGTMTTYQEVNLRENLLDDLTNLSPDANPLSTILKQIEVSQRLVEWGEYYLARESSVTPVIEGDDATYTDLTAQVRRSNYTQIIRKPFVVSESDIVANKVSPKDAYSREMGNAMTGYKNSQEWAVLRGSLNSGASGVGRGMKGIRNTIFDSGLTSINLSGVSLSEALFNDLELESWNVTDEKVFDLVLTTGSLKQRISGFTAGLTKNVEAADKRLVKTVSVYEGDFGMHEIRAHKDSVAKDLLCLRKDLVEIGYFRAPKHYEMGRTGSSRKGMIEGEATVIVRSPRPHVLRYNVL